MMDRPADRIELIPPVAAPDTTEERALVSSDTKLPDVVGRLKRMIVRNSATCVHCGEVMGCTHIDPEVWVTHRCDDATFAIRGGNLVKERSGTVTDYDDTSVYQNVIALSCTYNKAGEKFFLPEEVAA